MLCCINLNKDCLEILLCKNVLLNLKSQNGYTAKDYIEELNKLKSILNKQ